VVPLLQDAFWSSNPPPDTNLANIFQYADNSCGNSRELHAYGGTPLGGALTNMRTYFQSSFNGFASPLGTSSQERPCRSLNVILLTDGGETCGGNPVSAAQALYNGFTKDGITWSVKTHVIAFSIDAPADLTLANNIAKMGQCGATTGTCASGVNALQATNEVTLSAALAQIISNAIKPEDCNNVDDNCNGCVDEGYKHYCNRNRTPSTNPTNNTQCCSAARATCIANFQASITTANPTGNRWWLPCHTPSSLTTQLTDTANWLCYDPGEHCDELDNNCDGATPNSSTIDEEQLKCNGQCPSSEVCDGVDNDCNGIIDEAPGNANPYSIPGCVACVPSAEQCDGCDNDCNGIADDGVDPVACGIPTPPNCEGTVTCVPQAVTTPGGCVGGGAQWGTCSNNAQTEVCDGADNDCDGQIDEGIAPTVCDHPTIPNLVYQTEFSASVCKRGLQPCLGQCTGWVGPSTEICDGLDNNCNGQIDEGTLPGVGALCDGICGKGQMVCEGLAGLQCETVAQPQAEVCNGLDDDCNGVVDDGGLADAPATTSCWDLDASACPGEECTYEGSVNTASWCAPEGATCTGLGTPPLSSPCQLGSLVCLGGGWVCAGGLAPDAEVCDAMDNDCDGDVDEDLGTSTCGSDVGECEQGTQQCLDGKIECIGAVGPQPEICDGLDNDCDGENDNGIALGEPCWAPYDEQMYPGGERDKGQCKPGVSKCGDNGEIICEGGKGPEPEICDGLDNDCDGDVDELGAPNDGINGTTNPKPGHETEKIGEACGSDVGVCDPGKWACVNTEFACMGGVLPQPEVCDCQDNDCDGETDEDASAGEPALCSDDKACVTYAGGCQCAALCGGGEYPCPTGGFKCEVVNYSHDPEESAGARCVIDGCQDCANRTVTGASGVECAPAGTVLENGEEAPVCVCIQNACHRPCFGVTCAAPTVCTDFGPNAGKCVQDNCWNVPCSDGLVCNDDGACLDNPCKADTCAAGEVCKPSEDFTSHVCVGSCAGVTCGAGQRCEGGECVDTGCAEGCESGQVCNGTECVPSACENETCDDGSWCDPLTGECGSPPCEGVLCPSGQDCEGGECVEGSGGSGGAGGSGGSGGGGGQAGTGGGTSGTGASAGGPDGGTDGGTESEAKGNWGLATGGGGCACETGVGSSRTGGLAALMMLGISLLARRRKGRGGEDVNAPRNGGQR
jgi:hypothetical protein